MIWKRIKTFPSYFISEYGDVLTTRSRPGILKPSVDRGYKKVSLTKHGRAHTLKVHKLVAETFVHKAEGMYEVNHIDGNKLNNHYTNLEWTTRKGNMNHCDKLNLRTFSNGESHGMTSLTASQVMEMRSMYKAGVTSYPKLSKQYGVSISSAHRIVNGLTWKHL